MSKGVYTTKRKNGSFSYRASITFRNKHISLGSYDREDTARQAYLLADRLLNEGVSSIEEYDSDHVLSHDKWVVLHNFRDNGYYFKAPIYLQQKYFIYYMSQDERLLFDVDDLFYYSSHPIHRRGGYLFVNDYGMQVNILSRYGIQNHSVEGKDYRFVDGNPANYRYDNIEVINPYHGVIIEKKEVTPSYKARINLNGYYIIGRFKDPVTAAIAYNKAVDYVADHGISPKNFEKNYITHMTPKAYKEAYSAIKLGKNLTNLSKP